MVQSVCITSYDMIYIQTVLLIFSGCNNNAEHDDIASENDDETHSNVDEDLDEEDEEINVT